MSASIIDTLEYAMHVVVFISLVLVSLFSLEHLSITEMDSVPLVIMTWVDTQYVCK